MEKVTDSKKAYMSDEMYLPIHYRGKLVQKPVFRGEGEHSVTELEKLCQQFEEYCHQQATIKQNCKECILELRFEAK